MKKYLLLSTLLLCLSFAARSQAPINDSCGAAINIPVTSNAGTCTPHADSNYSTLTATRSPQASGDGSGKDDDVWFKFTSTSTQAIISVQNAVYTNGGGINIELWNTCGDASFNQWFPISSSGTAKGLTIGATYLVRVYTYGSTSRASSFKICVACPPPPPVNDDCSNAPTLTLNTGSTCTNTVNGTMANATANSSGTTSCAFESALSIKDVWYKFVATSALANITLSNVSLISGSSSNLALQLTGGCTTFSMMCSTNGALSPNFLTPGTTYYVRVYNTDPTSSSTFTICASIPAPPPNNECSGAYTLPVNTTANPSLVISGTTVASTASSGSFTCTGSPGADVWFKLKLTPAEIAAPGIFSIYCTSTIFSYALFTGSCGSLTQVAGWCGNPANPELPTLSAGTDYWLRVYNAGATTYSMALRKLPLAPPANDTCTTATDITSTVGTALYINGSTRNASVTTTRTDCYGFNAPYAKDVWHKFTLATAGTYLVDIKNLKSYSSFPAPRADVQVQVFTGADCGALMQFSCSKSYATDTAAGIITQATSVSTIYWLRIIETSNSPGWFVYDIGIKGISVPANDNETGAVTLVQDYTCNSTAGTFRAATLSTATVPTFAPSTPFSDVWYKFVASTSNPTITLNNTSNKVRLGLYNHPSTTTPLLIAASDNGTLACSGLIVGNTYSVRVYYTGTIAPPNSLEANFNICITGYPSALAANVANCTIADAAPVPNSTNSGSWLHLLKSGALIASVYDGPSATGAPFLPRGFINAFYYTHTGAVRSDAASIPYLNRNYEINVANNNLTNSPVKVRFYFSKAELYALIGTANSNVYNINDLRVARLSNASCSGVIGSGALYYNITGFGTITADIYFVEMIVPNFSGFFLQNVSETVLPVSCSDFSGNAINGKVQLSWATQTEVNSNYFEVQRSTDGSNFITIEKIASLGSGSRYSFTDYSAKSNQTYYYRLLQADKDGKTQFVCKTLQVANPAATLVFGNIHPNPVSDLIRIDILQPQTGKVDIQIINTLGQVVQQQHFSIQPHDVKLQINTIKLNAGIYSVKIITAGGVTVQPIIKQ